MFWCRLTIIRLIYKLINALENVIFIASQHTLCNSIKRIGNDERHVATICSKHLKCTHHITFTTMTLTRVQRRNDKSHCVYSMDFSFSITWNTSYKLYSNLLRHFPTCFKRNFKIAFNINITLNVELKLPVA